MKDGQTIGQWLKWDFNANGNLEIRNKIGLPIYWEHSGGGWAKYERNSEGNEIYYENSDGGWAKWEYDSEGNQIYFENSDGKIVENRTPEVIEHNGRKYQLIP